jgi:hypothetical protein
MFWIALAAQLSAPVPLNAGHWMTSDDVPVYLIQSGSGLWQVKVRIKVAPDGAVQGCEVESSGGIRQLDNLTCGILSNRAKFRPAQWGDGTPAFGIYRTTILWAVSESPWDTSKVSSPDLVIFVKSLPPGVRSPSLVWVMFEVDAEGRTSSCIAEPRLPIEHVDNNPALVPIACDQLMKSYKAVPAKDSASKAIPSVQNALVRFSTGQP